MHERLSVFHFDISIFRYRRVQFEIAFGSTSRGSLKKELGAILRLSLLFFNICPLEWQMKPLTCRKRRTRTAGNYLDFMSSSRWRSHQLATHWTTAPPNHRATAPHPPPLRKHVGNKLRETTPSMGGCLSHVARATATSEELCDTETEFAF